MLLALLSLSTLFSCASKEAETGAHSPADTEDTSISGVYEVSQVTCAGEVVPLSVTATVTFDGTDYLEEWAFPGLECSMTLEGTMNVSETELTIVDVELSCDSVCESEGMTCHSEPCSSDQTYQYNVDGDELLMSFTQAGDEFACGPCGDGVESSYLLVRTGQ